MKRFRTILFLLIFLSIGGFFWWHQGIAPVDSNNTIQHVFVIKEKQGVRDIAYNLKSEGLLKDPIAFFLLIKKMGLDGKIQAGNFQLSPSMSAEDIAKTLTHGTLDVWITIPEGKRATEIAEILKTNLSTYQDSWISTLVTHEGYLFPDTYRFPKNADLDMIIKIMTKNFSIKFATIQKPGDIQNSVTQTKAVILASIIEREAISSQDMKIVASVFQNRLDSGIALGSDVTLEYALGYQSNEKTWWKKDITDYDLQLHTPYNTRLNAGLPPTPICNPGLTSLDAAIHPANTDYLYFIADKQGKVHFAKTLEEHNRNIGKYL